jgi:hypothetical protein
MRSAARGQVIATLTAAGVPELLADLRTIVKNCGDSLSEQHIKRLALAAIAKATS